MDLHFFIFLYILVVAVIVEKFAFRKLIIKNQVNGVGRRKEIEKEEKGKRRGFVHLVHAYLIAFVLLILIISKEINFVQLPYYFMAIFFSFGVSFIYLFKRLFISLLSLMVIIFLVYLNISFLIETGNLYLNPSFYLLIALTLFPLYLAISRK